MLEGHQNIQQENKYFRRKVKQKFQKETKIKIIEGNQKLQRETKKFRKKPNILDEIRNKFWKETKNIGKEILIPPGHRTFLNIEISKEQRDCLCFLWYDDVASKNEVKPIIYRFARVVFGITSNPFLLNGTIRDHLKKYVESNQKFITKFIEDLYVDDTTSGCFSVDKGM